MRTIERLFRNNAQTDLFIVIHDSETKQDEVWYYPSDGRHPRHVRSYDNRRDAAAKAAQLADTVDELTTQQAWDKAVQS